jgi:cysteinyl-tRNA synthetase
LHLGGEDLVFPHHEDEIAQSEGAGAQASGEPFVRYWLHGAFLLAEGKKMSKSLGNFYTLRDLLAKGFTGREVRYVLLSGHYREQFNFTLESLSGARTALARLDDCLLRLREVAGTMTAAPVRALLDPFTAALDDDFNVSAAWGAIFEWVRELNRQLAASAPAPAQAAAALAAWAQADAVIGVGDSAEGQAPAAIVAFLEQRQAARKARDFERADAIRDELKAKGWVIEDTPKGPRLKRVG